MKRFINFDASVGVSINTFCKPDGTYNDDVRGLVEDIRAGRPGCCDLDGSKAALEDGSLWADGDQETLELVHAAICDYEREVDAEA